MIDYCRYWPILILPIISEIRLLPRNGFLFKHRVTFLANLFDFFVFCFVFVFILQILTGCAVIKADFWIKVKVQLWSHYNKVSMMTQILAMIPSKYGTGRSRYLALKERRSRLARSRSSHFMGNDDDDTSEQATLHTTSPTAYLASRCEHCSVRLFLIFCIHKNSINSNQNFFSWFVTIIAHYLNSNFCVSN